MGVGCTGLPCGKGLTSFTTICSRKRWVGLSLTVPDDDDDSNDDDDDDDDDVRLHGF